MSKTTRTYTGSDNYDKMTGRRNMTGRGKLPSQKLEHDNHDWGQNLDYLDLPASRDEIIAQARAHGMSDEMIELIQHLPENRYTSMDDVRKGLRGNS